MVVTNENSKNSSSSASSESAPLGNKFAKKQVKCEKPSELATRVNFQSEFPPFSLALTFSLGLFPLCTHVHSHFSPPPSFLLCAFFGCRCRLCRPLLLLREKKTETKQGKKGELLIYIAHILFIIINAIAVWCTDSD